jgi:glyoxylase-like metal-dependent hydrolase (beta-lactamase superfamily II)
MNNEHLPISRRRLLAGTSAVAAAGLLDAFPSQTAFAKAPMLDTQAPYFYRFKLGNFEGTIVSDGTLPLGKPEDNFVGLTKPEMGKQLTDNFLPLENVVLEQNALVINTGDKLVLFDTGMGGLKLFGPTTGKLLSSMKQAGIDPKDIDAVVMSHAHIDHCGGCMADDGSRHFPNAQYYITEADYDFWTTESNVPAQFKVFWETATKNLKPNRERMQFIKDGEEIIPGVHAMLAPGHTVGHTIFMIDSGGEAAVLRRRSRPPSGLAAAEAADRVQVRYRPEAVGGVAREGAQHAGGKEDPAARVSLRMAGHRPRGQAGRRLPLLSGRDEDGAVIHLSLLKTRFECIDGGARHAARLFVECSAAQAQGMSSSSNVFPPRLFNRFNETSMRLRRGPRARANGWAGLRCRLRRKRLSARL